MRIDDFIRGSVERGGQDHNPDTTQKEEERGEKLRRKDHSIGGCLACPHTALLLNPDLFPA